MKRVHPICTFLGAFPGAMPPVLGWTAIRGRLDPEALVLFAIVFFWQFPHFHSIAWLYREDYENARIRMLPVVESDGRSTAFAIVMYALALVPVSLAPTLMGMSGWTYFAGALLLGLRHAVVQPAHVDDETDAGRSRVEGARASCAAGLGDLPAAAVRADDAQSRVTWELQPASAPMTRSSRRIRIRFWLHHMATSETHPSTPLAGNLWRYPIRRSFNCRTCAINTATASHSTAFRSTCVPPKSSVCSAPTAAARPRPSAFFRR